MLMKKLKNYTDECLQSKRWNGNIVQMIVDASITSVGLSYFGVVVPKVKEFPLVFSDVTTLEALASSSTKRFLMFFKNKRTWHVATSIAKELLNYGDGVNALREWARQADAHKWKQDSIGKINGIGINTFQYLRMMGGINTIMPDKIVKKYVKKQYGMTAKNDIEFIDKVHDLHGSYSPIELCWLSWLVESNESSKEI